MVKKKVKRAAPHARGRSTPLRGSLKARRVTRRKPTAKQLAARAKFVAMVRNKYRPRKKTRGQSSLKTRVNRAHRVCAITRKGERYYLSYDRLTLSGTNAQHFSSDDAAKLAAKKLARMPGVRRRFVKIVST